MRRLTQAEYEAAGKIKASGDEIRIQCTECDDTNYHLYVNTVTDLYHCFKCGFSGKLLKENTEFPNLSSFNRIRQDLHLKISETDDRRIVRSLPFNKRINITVGGLYYEYLRGRGVTRKEIERHQIRGSTDRSGIYMNTVIFPIGAVDSGHLRFFVARKIDGTEPKYINAPWDKEDTFFVATPDFPVTKSPIVLVEGIFDALAVARAGYYSYALLGKTISKPQIQRLVRENQPGMRYLVFLDSDALAYAITLNFDIRSALPASSRVVTSEYHDPDSIPTEILRELLDGYTKS